MYHRPWQSWSPSSPNLVKLPQRDYCPIKQVAAENKKPPNFHLKPPITGWCSWYAAGPNINLEFILDQTKKAAQLGLDYILIDDGWCKWGDWQSPNHRRFPTGIAGLSKQIAKFNLKTGLWLSPFLVDPYSNTALNHPDWLVKNNQGKPLNGWLVTPFDHLVGFKKYILDLENPEARSFIYRSIDIMISKWQVNLLKLDFLYAPYFNPKYTTDRVPHQILTDLFIYIKTNYPKVYTIACGCPYKPARYLVDAIRIAKDATVPLLDTIPVISSLIRRTRYHSTLQNWRYLQNQKSFFHLDPDVQMDEKFHEPYQQSFVQFIGYRLK